MGWRRRPPVPCSSIDRQPRTDLARLPSRIDASRLYSNVREAWGEMILVAHHEHRSEHTPQLLDPPHRSPSYAMVRFSAGSAPADTMSVSFITLGGADARPDLVDRRRLECPVPVRDRLEGGRDAAPDRAGPATRASGASTPPTSAAITTRPRSGRPSRRRSRAAWWPGRTCSCRPSSPSGAGQDHRLPYDPEAPIAVQVEQSFASSLEHLGTEVIDSYLLHGPTQRSGLAPADWEAWRAMEAIHDSGRARLLGVSNVTLEQLQAPLPAGARPAPLRPEPLLRRPGLGPRRPGVLRRQRDGLPGLLAADRQPRGAGPSRAGPDRRTPRPDRQPRSSSGSPSTSAWCP